MPWRRSTASVRPAPSAGPSSNRRWSSASGSTGSQSWHRAPRTGRAGRGVPGAVDIHARIAEALYCGYRATDAVEEFARHSGGGGLDFRRVDFLMDCLCEMSRRRRVLMPYVRRTIAFLEAHWAEVEALARALIEEKNIEGDRIAEIVDAATGRAFRRERAAERC
jgi:hypothetical protein